MLRTQGVQSLLASSPSRSGEDAVLGDVLEAGSAWHASFRVPEHAFDDGGLLLDGPLMSISRVVGSCKGSQSRDLMLLTVTAVHWEVSNIVATQHQGI